VRVGQLDRNPARAPLGYDAHENHYLVTRVDKALGLETPLGPCIPKHGAQSSLSLPAPEDRLALRVAAGKLKLVLLVEKVTKRPIEKGVILVGVCVSQIRKQRVPATDKLNVLRHGPPSIPRVGSGPMLALPALGRATSFDRFSRAADPAHIAAP
jgi:hypothetical protein